MLVFLIIMAAVFSCSAPNLLHFKSAAIAPTESSLGSQISFKNDKKLLENATQFDALLNEKLSEKETTALEEQCRRSPSENSFCFSILNRQYFMKKAELIKKRRTYSRRRRWRVYPKFRGSKLKNWSQLKAASVSASLRGISSLSSKKLDIVTAKALNETNCPNNVAISIAATLEDRLPNETKPEQVAKLYEAGGKCMTRNGSDRVTMLTRAGLFYYSVKQYSKALENFKEAASTKSAFLARALYWLNQTHTKLGNKPEATKAIEELKERYPFAFHTLVAMIRNKEDPGELLLVRSPNQLKRSHQMPFINPLIEQTEILNNLGFAESAAVVLNWAVAESRGTEPEVKIYLAELKKEYGDYFSKITILSDVLYKYPSLVSKETMELYFPKVYFPLFEKQSSMVDPFLLLSIARRESAFNLTAVSHADARGLLQILPKTRDSLMKNKDLLDPNDNVAVGAYYVKTLLKKTNGQIHLALASYNAGPHKMMKWVERYPVDDPILFTDLIPYRETREYVASIMRNYYWYRRIHQDRKLLNDKQFIELAITKGG